MPEPTEPRAASAAIAFRAVTFAYERMPAVRDVSTEVALGAMVALLGPNGAGKTTLLKLAAGVLRPTHGHVALCGEDVQRLPRKVVARRVAVVPQGFSVQFAYTVRQLVEMGRAPHLGPLGIAAAGDRAAVEDALDVTATRALADRVFNDLSGGERQRVILALALAQQPRIILLDEPTAHLDIKHQIEVLELLQRLNRERGLTVFAALHDLNLAARYFPRLILFSGGIVADGSPAEVLQSQVLSRIYETPVQVGILRGEEHLSVLPPGQPPTRDGLPGEHAAVRARVHVFAGGGSGELLMRALADAHLAFSAGPLNAGDSDHVLAERLAQQCITEPPYAPVSPQGLAAARERVAMSRSVIICPMPLGHGNIALFEVALEGCRAGRDIMLLEPTGSIDAVAARDYSGRGVALYQDLMAAGARLVTSPAGALAQLRTAPDAYTLAPDRSAR